MYTFIPAAPSSLLPGSHVRVMEDGQWYEARVVRKTKTGVTVERKLGNSTETWTVQDNIEVCKYRIMDVAGKRVLHNVGNTIHKCTLSVMGAETVVVLRIIITAHGRVDIMGNAGVEGVGEAQDKWVSTRSGSFLVVGRTRIARMEVLESNDQPESDAVSALVSMRALGDREAALREREEREGALEEREAAMEVLEASLNEREAALKEREAIFEVREATVEAAMNEREVTADVREATVEAAMNEREVTADVREATVEAALKERETALEKREEASLHEREATLEKREAYLKEREAAIAELDDKVYNHWYGLKRKLEEAERRNLQLELERTKYFMSDTYARPHMNALAHSVSVLKDELSDLQKEIREAKRQRV